MTTRRQWHAKGLKRPKRLIDPEKFARGEAYKALIFQFIRERRKTLRRMVNSLMYKAQIPR